MLIQESSQERTAPLNAETEVLGEVGGEPLVCLSLRHSGSVENTRASGSCCRPKARRRSELLDPPLLAELQEVGPGVGVVPRDSLDLGVYVVDGGLTTKIVECGDDLPLTVGREAGLFSGSHSLYKRYTLIQFIKTARCVTLL